MQSDQSEELEKPLQPFVIFSNPEKKPLGELTLLVTDGVQRKIPALNKHWAPRDWFTHYVFLVGSGGKIKTGADLDEWIYESTWFYKDMRFILELEHYEFWSYMVYQKPALNAIVSFLSQATPFYLDIQSLTSDEKVITLYQNIVTTIGRIICRIITNKESDEEWIAKDHLKDLIYSNFLISIPILFDLLIALGEPNVKILEKIFATVFTIEPKYTNDLTSALHYFKVVFDTIQTQAENEGAVAGEDKENKDLDTPYDDLVFFTLDMAFTLSLLLEVYPSARKICCDIKLAQKISSFYDNTLTDVYKNIYTINPKASSLSWFDEARVQLLRAFRNIVYVHIDAVLADPANSMMPSEDFVAVMTECLADRIFVIDYQRTYPIELDVDILKQACKDLDDFKTDFVAKGYKDEAESEMISSLKNLELDESEEPPCSSEAIPSMPQRMEPEGASSSSVIDYDDDKPSTSRAAQHKTQAARKIENPKSRDIDLEVATVLDVLPHLGDGFIRRVLNRYDNSEEAIAAILEQNLPPDLIHSDQSEVYIPPDPQDALYEQTGVKRYNVFDGDKYDIMTQDNPDCVIKIGKGFPSDPRHLGEMLDDKRELNAVRHRYQEYTLVEEGEGGDLYDDEYDDSYEAILDGETKLLKPHLLKEKLAEIEDVSSEESEEEPEEVETKTNRYNTYEDSKDKPDNRMNFCENPEDVRARYEARRAAKFANSGRAPPPQPPRDVVGTSKGQGQSKEVLLNRRKKDANKSSRANHNRKSGAAFKRSKGMMS